MDQTISIVIPTWNQPTNALERMLRTIDRQTLPPLETIIVDGGPTDKYNVAKFRSNTVRVIDAYIPQFSLSRLFNIGIRRARGRYVMTTGNDRLLSDNFIEVASEYASPDGLVGGTWGFLLEDTDLDGDWDYLLSHILKGSNTRINPGSFQIISKSWHEHMHGFDEQMPFAYVDSDITRRATSLLAGRDVIPYGKAQILHQWHRGSPLVAELGVTLAEFEKKTGIIRNPSGWGELPDGAPLDVSFIFTWKQRDSRYLRCCLHSLSHQTHPPAEIVVTDQDADPKIEALCAQYPLVTYIAAPREDFSLTWGFNVGIKRTVGDFVICTGAEFVFSRNYVETIRPCLKSGIWLDSENAPLVQHATGTMLDHPDPDTALFWGQPFTQFPRGLHRAGFFGATKAWLEKVHGWNEDFPFACADAEIWERAVKDDLEQVFIGIDEAQIFHLTHPRSPYLDLDKKYFDAYPHSPVVVNPEGWGEL